VAPVTLTLRAGIVASHAGELRIGCGAMQK
jgi:hypothetical protein